MTHITDDSLLQQFQSVENDFSDALTSNDVHRISAFLFSDWILLEPQFGIIDKERFLDVISLGDLSHTSMRKTVLRVTIHNEIAFVTTRGMNIGFYKQTPFHSEQWVTNVYRKENEDWICIMSQESPVSCK